MPMLKIQLWNIPQIIPSTIFQVEKSESFTAANILNGLYIIHMIFPIIQPQARIYKFGYISQTLFTNGLFLICILCKTFKEQKKVASFKNSQPISKVCRIELHAAVKLLSKNF